MANLWPAAAPAIMQIIGKTYSKNKAFNNEDVSKLSTTRSPTLAPAGLRASTIISFPPSSMTLQESLEEQDAHELLLVVFAQAVAASIFVIMPSSVAKLNT